MSRCRFGLFQFGNPPHSTAALQIYKLCFVRLLGYVKRVTRNSCAERHRLLVDADYMRLHSGSGLQCQIEPGFQDGIAFIVTFGFYGNTIELRVCGIVRILYFKGCCIGTFKYVFPFVDG